LLQQRHHDLDQAEDNVRDPDPIGETEEPRRDRQQRFAEVLEASASSS
jgi:hypothetical protein